MNNNQQRTRSIAVNGLLAAVICIISFMPLRTLGLEITLSMVPVAIGASLFGSTSGAALGGVFGIVSFIQCLGYSPFGAGLISIDPFATFMVCVPTRILAGFLAGAIASGIRRGFSGRKTSLISFAVSSITAPILNTLFFMSTLCIFFYNTDYIQGFAGMLGAQNVFMFILLFVGINGLVEIAAGFALALPLSKALSKAFK